MFCLASRTLCGNSKIELKITDSEIFEDTYKGAASENKQSAQCFGFIFIPVH